MTTQSHVTPEPQEPTVVELEPRGVLVGVGGDPLSVGLIFFGVAAFALGMSLIGPDIDFLPAASQGAIIPLLVMGAGLFQAVTTVWAILLGQSLVAAIFSTFSAFWLSFSVLLLGLGHNWLGVAPGDVDNAQELFFLSWALLFLVLTIPCLALPAVYPLAVGLVFVANLLAALAVFTETQNLFTVAGIVALVFAFLAFYSWVHVALKSVGVTTLPPLGRPILR
jgi:succinate-acetate transporter protein